MRVEQVRQFSVTSIERAVWYVVATLTGGVCDVVPATIGGRMSGIHFLLSSGRVWFSPKNLAIAILEHTKRTQGTWRNGTGFRNQVVMVGWNDFATIGHQPPDRCREASRVITRIGQAWISSANTIPPIRSYSLF